MAYRDYLHLREIPLAELKNAVGNMQLLRLVNLGYHLKKYPLKKGKQLPNIKSFVFDKLAQSGVGKLQGWNPLVSNIPSLSKTSKFGKLPKIFRDVKRPGRSDGGYTWPGIPEMDRELERLGAEAETAGAKAALELRQKEAAKTKVCGNPLTKALNPPSSKPEVPKVLTKELPKELPKLVSCEFFL
ncbi:unnamed protein product [Cylicostephanus goldi]|uniref:Uncharacterized protein n=1 Tax=Cylicostephanus goldi TaxID=71465 RepID=A0A3P6SJM9_CYLGO|nr:unnamed protein product [Cylicostephanus goldi]